jgi:hypothetical protein
MSDTNMFYKLSKYIGVINYSVFSKLNLRLYEVEASLRMVRNNKMLFEEDFDIKLAELHRDNPMERYYYDVPEAINMPLDESWIRYHTEMGKIMNKKYDYIKEMVSLLQTKSELLELINWHEDIKKNIYKIVRYLKITKHKKSIPLYEMPYINVESLIRAFKICGVKVHVQNSILYINKRITSNTESLFVNYLYDLDKKCRECRMFIV